MVQNSSVTSVFTVMTCVFSFDLDQVFNRGNSCHTSCITELPREVKELWGGQAKIFLDKMIPEGNLRERRPSGIITECSFPRVEYT